MIKIITVYNSLNPGSFFQATALYKKIKEKFSDDVCFFNISARHPIMSGIKLSVKLLLKFKVKEAFFQLRMPLSYINELSTYRIKTKKNMNDIYILGSDEIWNISRKKILNHKEFFGIGINTDRCISYAPSVNNSNINDFEKYSDVISKLKNIHYISVRDNHSQKIIETITNRKVKKVLDPTMLLTLENYKNIQSKKKYNNYIFVYGSPRRFPESLVNEIKDYAKRNNKKIISYYFQNEWCDNVEYGSPMEFLSLINYSDFVITNTFHGTIFSIIYNKKFITISKENLKVHELVKEFNLDVEYDNSKSLVDYINTEIEYDEINKKISNDRKISEDYLFESINKIKKEGV